MREGESVHTHTPNTEVMVLTGRIYKQYYIYIDEEGRYVEVKVIDGGLLSIIYDPVPPSFEGCSYTCEHA